ncbi:MAG: polysaccharide deacetylase family protein [Chloroflexi bacterium]|nr:polysaccharide deacetylase family protein [Chloroflexota bacterium]
MKKAHLLAEVLHKVGLTRGLNVFWGRDRLTVLAYHRIIEWDTPEFRDYEPVVSATPAMFEQQMTFVAEHFNVIDLAALQAYLFDNKPLPERPLLITFDDGYLDNYQNAYPVLKKHGFPAVIFLVTSRMDDPARLWWDVCGYAFRATRKNSAALPYIGQQPLASAAERRAARELLMLHLKHIPDEQKQAEMQQLCAALDVSLPADERLFVTWDQVRELVANGIACQPHTVTHPIMTRVSYDEQKRQLTEARARIIDETGQKADAFAYPNGAPGDYDAATLRALRETGYSTAFTLTSGPMSSSAARRHPLQIKRVYLGYRDSFEVFALKTMGLEAFIDRAPFVPGEH